MDASRELKTLHKHVHRLLSHFHRPILLLFLLLLLYVETRGLDAEPSANTGFVLQPCEESVRFQFVE